MPSLSSFRTAASVSVAASALSLSSAALAQVDEREPMSAQEVEQLPADMQSAPAPTEFTEETRIGEDGVETITRTRRIESRAPGAPAYQQAPASGSAFAPSYYAPTASVFEREQWIEECNRRTAGRSDEEKGSIIGGLLGAIAGGIIGNRVADGDRLAGTLIGAGTGGLGGFLLGNLIGGSRDRDEPYDCEAALDSYLSQYGQGPVRIASRNIPSPAYGYPGYYTPGPYGYAPAYGYNYAPPQQIVYVPVRYEQQYQVVVRETVREETYEVPGDARDGAVPQPER